MNPDPKINSDDVTNDLRRKLSANVPKTVMLNLWASTPLGGSPLSDTLHIRYLHYDV